MAGIVRGGCLCGAVTFEVTGTFRRANYCHQRAWQRPRLTGSPGAA